MDFLGIGPFELLIILVVALLVFGPEKMVDAARALGRFSRKVSQTGRQFTRALEQEVGPVTKSVGKEVDSIARMGQDLNRTLTQQAGAVTQAGQDLARTVNEGMSPAAQPEKKGQESAGKHDEQGQPR